MNASYIVSVFNGDRSKYEPLLSFGSYKAAADYVEERRGDGVPYRIDKKDAVRGELINKEKYVRDDQAWVKFAASAMNALLASHDMQQLTVAGLSRVVADYADAMMIEREKRIALPLRKGGDHD